ncbi:MAG: FG-GAP-like repeat-containing protein, partial [Eubacteriales bacterium]|nr:FG-GAP-like repeat-containing protein [Eubacteriales bacterium]
GAAWADYDNDGFLDLYVANFLQPNCLYRNNGDGSFTKITEGEIVTDNFNTYSASWADYDNDGFQDMYVVNYFYSALPGQNDCLYHNNGDGTFTKNTSSIIANDLALTQGSSWGDFNNDGLLDLFVTVNDFGDIKHNLLYKNLGNGDFVLVNSAPSIDGGVSFGSAWLDMNNDGYLDLTVSNNGGSTKRLNYLYLNNGDETFTNQVADEATLTPLRDYCSTISDYNHDGYPDIFTPSYSTTLIHGLYKNNGGTNNWVSVRLEGTVSNRSAIGARIYCYTNGIKQTREVSSTSGQYVGSSLTQTFGIAATSAIDSLVINWPSGIHQVIENPIINQIHQILEEELMNNETDILSFSITQQTGAAIINTTEHTIAIEVANGTILTALAPDITVSAGAIINPSSGSIVDFSGGPVDYTVTAENGTDTQVWIVTVTEEIVLNNETNILTFILSQQTGAAIINATAHTVTIEVANGANLTSLAPTITVSAGASINPVSGAIVDFSAGAVSYTVTAENGFDSQVWMVTVSEEIVLNNETDILAFMLSQQTSPAIINTTAHTIIAEVSYGTSLTALAPEITVSSGAIVNPLSGSTVDFSSGAVSYTVTAENGIDSQIWMVTVTEAPVGIYEPNKIDAKLVIFPNPLSGDGNIYIIVEVTGEYELSLTNRLGQIIQNFTLDLVGNESQVINLGNMENGMYAISIKGAGIQAVRKVIIAQ